MNLRQKAKHYKRLAELYGAKTIQPQIVYQEYETRHLSDMCHFDPYMDDAGMLIRQSEDRLLESVRPYIVTNITDDEIFGGKRIQSDICVVDRR